MKEGGTESEFGYEWHRYREILPMHERQFAQWISPLPLKVFRGKRFLDAGCGIGRNSYWALMAGAASAYAFDYDERTVMVARENLKEFPNCEVGFESIYDFRRVEEFDIAFSIGVIHHLEEPARAVANIVRALKPGGTLILWVYGYEGNERYVKLFDPLRRRVTSRINPAITRLIAKGMTAFLKIYLLLPNRRGYMAELKQRSFRHVEAIVFDQLLPHIANYWRRDEVMNLVSGLPLEDIVMTHTNGVSWTLVGKKSIKS